MSMLEMLLQGGGGAAAEQIGARFGLSPDQTRAAMGQLLPAVMGGFKKQAQAPGGLEGLVAALGQSGAAQFGANPAAAVADPQAAGIGNAVLGQIFGSKDVSRAVASQAAQTTGVSDSVLKQMLPMIAALAAGQLGAQVQGAAAAPAAGGAGMGGGLGGGLGGMIGGLLGAAGQGQSQNQGSAGGLGGLAKMLDLDGDGNPLDDIAGLAGKLLR